MIEVIREMHQNSLIHCDIKPANFCLEYGKTEFNELDDIKAIDFGLTGLWWNNREKKHTQWCDDIGPLGTPDFESTSSLKGERKSRRDDMEEICYSLIHFLTGNLPWTHMRENL